jgi:hypothetical protein
MKEKPKEMDISGNWRRGRDVARPQRLRGLLKKHEENPQLAVLKLSGKTINFYLQTHPASEAREITEPLMAPMQVFSLLQSHPAVSHWAAV